MKIRFSSRRVLSILLAMAFSCPLHADPPDLVLLVTVDQLRGDMPTRFRTRFGPGGFRYLMDNGTVFTNAHYEHLNTTTAPGHATLATGGNAPQHGIVGNDWFDSQTRQTVYNTEDRRHSVIGASGDPAEGRSPKNLTSTTFGDELVLASAGRSRVFSVSIKDRGAILPGGHTGKAFWYSDATGRFVTSTWYYDTYPVWMARWNAENPAAAFRDAEWSLLLPAQTYTFRDRDDRWFERSFGRLGRTFPHPLRGGSEALFHETLPYTPMGDQLTLEFLETLVEAENVGRNGATDLLAVSFSATDYIGHAFGPYSLEAEDNLLRLDRTLAKLFAFIDERTGLRNTLVVLAADHGVSPSPEYMAELGYDAGRLKTTAVMRRINNALRQKYRISSDLAIEFQWPSLYLDTVAVDSLGLDLADVERTVAQEAMAIHGVALALTRSDLMNGALPSTPAARLAANAFQRQRSGNVLLVEAAFWYLEKTADGDTATHGSVYNYDNHVPIMIAGPGIGRGTVDTRVAPHDLAPTICNYLGIAAPSGSVGQPLPFVKAD
jgi:predicted AlkP superfamily pyrophosphatase or phosphodiesterase